jgi:hypothetical protein
MANCGNITQGAVYDCNNLLKGGTQPRLILFNYEDVLSTTPSMTIDNLITAITLAGGTTGYAFNGYRNDVKPLYESINLGVGQNVWKHQVSFIIYDISQEQKNNIQRIALGKFVAIVENNGKGTNAFEVLGLGSGLEIVPGQVRDPFASLGAYTLSLATAEGEFEGLLPQTLFNTDYATTLSQINAQVASES